MTTPTIDSIDTAAVVNGGDEVLSLETMNESQTEEQGQQLVQLHGTPTAPTTTATEKSGFKYDTWFKDSEMDQDQLIHEEEEDEPFEFPESTFTFLITENVFSIGFATAIMTQILSLTCLFLAFKNQMSAGSSGNELGMAAEVSKEVHVTRYIAILLAILNESEVPHALELVGKAFQQKASAKDRISFKRIVFSSCMRFLLGYTFLCSVFVVIVQVTDVLSMFMNILALSFVQSHDDIVFELAKRGFLGRAIMSACEPVRMEIDAESSDGKLNSVAVRSNRIVRFFFTFNIIFGWGAVSYYGSTQRIGDYRCTSITVMFGDGKEGGPTAPDEYWGGAYVNGKEKLLMFSHFNGVYIEDGLVNGFPRFVEQNKVDGHPYKEVIPAEIIYCSDIGSWVFWHPNIKTSPPNKPEYENDCLWLMKSEATSSFDIIESGSSTWYMWDGSIQPGINVVIKCNDCGEEGNMESCNYNGECGLNGEMLCNCDTGYYGTNCEYKAPCNVMESEKDEDTKLALIAEKASEFLTIYGKPVYVINEMSGQPISLLRLGYPEVDTGLFTDDDFMMYNNVSTKFQEFIEGPYSVVLKYTGLRWLGDLMPPGKYYYSSTASDAPEEYHAFWDNAFSGLGESDNSTFIISAPALKTFDPEGVDFYEMRRRNIPNSTYPYGPMGVLIPLIEYQGSGFFHCSD